MYAVRILCCNYMSVYVYKVQLTSSPVGIGVYVQTGDTANNVPIGTLTDNGIVVALSSGDTTFRFQCRSGTRTIDRQNDQFIGLDGSELAHSESGTDHGALRVSTGSVHPSVLVIRSTSSLPALSAEEEGVYTCRMLDENGDTVEVNVGIYRNGFNSE